MQFVWSPEELWMKQCPTLQSRSKYLAGSEYQLPSEVLQRGRMYEARTGCLFVFFLFKHLHVSYLKIASQLGKRSSLVLKNWIFIIHLCLFSTADSRVAAARERRRKGKDRLMGLNLFFGTTESYLEKCCSGQADTSKSPLIVFHPSSG